MTKLKKLDELVKTGEAVRLLSRADKLRIAADAFLPTLDVQYRTIRGVEDFDLKKLRSLKTGGTVLQPVRKALGEAGVHVNGTVGSLMDALEIDQEQLHTAVCWCHEESDHMTGRLANARFAAFADGSLG